MATLTAIKNQEEIPVTVFEVADLFCGAGGSSTGAQKAIEEELGGVMNLRAVNHWNTAIATHRANHPKALHIVEDVNIVDPESVVENGYLDILMASPECKYHSRARGGKPIHDQGRMHPWAIHNWLTKLDVRCVLIENVPEFISWGPVIGGRPDKTQKGKYFQSWFMTFLNLGYQAQWRKLNAADFGDATTRIRFFLIARKDGIPIRWPEPTHAKGDTGMFTGRQLWRAARDIIDWDNPGKSLLDDPKYKRTPLKPKTRARIARGLERFGGELAPLYIRLLDLEDQGDYQSRQPAGAGQPLLLNHHGEDGSNRSHSVEEPMPAATGRGDPYPVNPQADAFHSSDRKNNKPRSMEQPVYTITGLTGGGLYIVRPEAQPFVQANRSHNAPKGTDEPIPTITTAHGGGSFIVNPEIQPFIIGQQSGATPRSTDKPAPTIASKGAISLIQPYIARYNGQSGPEEVALPLSTILGCNKHALVKPILIEYYGDIRNQDVDDPLTTITQRAKHGLVSPALIDVNHAQKGDDVEDSRTHSVEDPVPSPTTKRGMGLVNPSIIEVNHGNGNDGQKGNNRRVHSVDDPLGSITANPGLALASPILVQTAQTGGNGSYSRSTDDPLPTLTTRNDINVVTPQAKPYIVANFSERDGQEPRTHDIDKPVPAVTSRGAGSLVIPLLQQLEEAQIDPRRLVFVDGQPFLLDIRFRMLQNAELARAMGFDDDESSYEFKGNVAEVTKQIGNAVPVNLAAALVKAILGAKAPDPADAESA